MIILVPSFLAKLVGRVAAQIVCSVITLSFYVLVYRLLVAFAPFKVDPVVFIAVALVFHAALITYLQLRKLDE